MKLPIKLIYIFIAAYLLPQDIFSQTRGFKSVDTLDAQVLEFGKYYAFIIANQEYLDKEITSLSEPINDAEHIRNVLVELYGFDEENVIFLKNPKRSDIYQALSQLGKSIGKNDNLLIFYAGHGYYDEESREGYWLPADGRKIIRDNWISNADIRDNLRDIKARHTLLISDACFSGGIFKMRSAFSDESASIREMLNKPSCRAMTSGTLNEVPDRSVFIEYLLKYLKENKDKYLSAQHLFSNIQEPVTNNSPIPQLPQYGIIQEAGDEGGDFIFYRTTETVAKETAVYTEPPSSSKEETVAKETAVYTEPHSSSTQETIEKNPEKSTIVGSKEGNEYIQQDNFQVFYDQLSPYGQWVDYGTYGYVWMPSVEPGFSPYATEGHWIFTDYGLTWVSDHPWGWATFHYGRWGYDHLYGWFWVPGDEWGPAWVSWRKSPDYYGWAPLKPDNSTSIAYGNEYHERNKSWIFVSNKDITRTDVSRHYVNQSENITLINNSTVIMVGPDKNEVERITNKKIKSFIIRENNHPGQELSEGELRIYRPQVQKNRGNGKNPVPLKVTRLSDINPSERNLRNQQEQSHIVNTPERNLGNQQEQLRIVNPPKRKLGNQQEQLRIVNPPKRKLGNQQKQSRIVNPPKRKLGNQQKQSRIVNPPKKKLGNQQKQLRIVNPPERNAENRQQQPRIVSPSNKR